MPPSTSLSQWSSPEEDLPGGEEERRRGGEEERRRGGVSWVAGTVSLVAGMMSSAAGRRIGGETRGEEEVRRRGGRDEERRRVGEEGTLTDMSLRSLRAFRATR